MCRNVRSATKAHDLPLSSAARRQVSKSEGQMPSSFSSNQAHPPLPVVPHSASRIPHFSFCVLRLRGAFLCVRTASGRLLGNWLHFHSRLQQLQTGRHHFLAVLQAGFHDAFAFEKGASLKITSFDRVIGFHDEGVFQALL